MSTFNRGLAFLRDQQASLGLGRNRINKLWLKGGEVARLYFVQDYEDIAVVFVHMEERKRKDGRAYFADVICGRTSLQDDRSLCSRCAESDRNPSMRYVALVWVDTIVHIEKKDGTDWKPASSSTGRTVYLEEVKDFRLFIMKYKMAEQINTYLEGDPMDPDAVVPTTLLDTSWKYTVTGTLKDRQDTLAPDKPKPTEEITETLKGAPDLESLILAEFGVPPKPSTDASPKLATAGDFEQVDYTEDLNFD